MENTRKKNLILFIVITIIILAIGCTTAFIHNRNITKERAAKAAMQYIKKEDILIDAFFLYLRFQTLTIRLNYFLIPIEAFLFRSF